MSKFIVVKPFARSTPNGFETFTHGNLIEMDEKDAAGMIGAGILVPAAEGAEPLEEAKDLRTEEIETADVKPASVEKAVKRGKKEK